jgi:hypothetical protein
MPNPSFQNKKANIFYLSNSHSQSKLNSNYYLLLNPFNKTDIKV